MRSLVTCCLLVWGIGAVGAACAGEPAPADIEQWLARPPVAVEHIEQLRELYARRHFEALWTVKGRLSAQGRQLLTALGEAQDRGLPADDYDTRPVLALLARSSRERLAGFDVELSSLAARFLEDLHQGRTDPHAAGFELPAGPPPLALAPLLTLMASAHRVDTVIDSVEPPFNHYRLLKAALRRYRHLAAQPGLSDLPRARATIKPGARYAGAPALRRLLHALGDLPEAPRGGLLLDPQLVKALKHFQYRHGINPSGSLDRATYAALTVPLAQRVRQIELTLERWRWLPAFDTPPIIVNIPQFRLFAFRSTQDLSAYILQMDVIVGERYPKKRTPVFASDMRYVIFRPYWDIPQSILDNEMLPRIRANPRYLQAEHLEIVQGDSDEGRTPLPPTPANIEALAQGKLRLRQAPGADNALGLIKLMFPNSHDVYLHSTPAHQLFRRSQRDFSHGCIRVADPVALAVQVLRDTPGDWTRAKVEAAMHSGPDDHRVNLVRPIHVFILYATVLATEDGNILFFRDIYGLDHELETLLKLPPVTVPEVSLARPSLLKASVRARATPRS